MNPPLCIVVKGFPRLSETFVTRELEALEVAGLKFSLASLRHPQSGTGGVSHRVKATVNRLPEYLHEAPWRVLRGYHKASRAPGFARAWKMFRAGLTRDWSRNRVRRFGQACVLASELPPETRHLHAHFIHTPASVAFYAAAIRGVTFSVSAHAKDIWTTPEWDLAEKLSQAEFVCTCNEAGASRLRELASGRPVNLWPHLTAEMAESPRQDRAAGPIRLLTVARAVPKKGLRLLIDALARLPPSPEWSWTHIGDGPELQGLRKAAEHHPYKDRIRFLGARPNTEVLGALSSHDVFVLTAQVADDGDRDGRPNALIEAMSASLACVATGAGGIPELLRPDAGVIVTPEPSAIANALAGLILKPENIAALGAAARSRAHALQDIGRASFADLEKALRRASGQ